MDDGGTAAGHTAQKANPGYATFQIAKALATAGDHADPAARERGRLRAEKWASVLQGMMSGALSVGSRTPLPEIPVWITPEVVTGGFATGALMAGGPLLDHEHVLLARLSAEAAPEPRRVLNAYFIGDEGFALLGEWLRTGHYMISVPEEGALPVVAWLVANGHVEMARRLIDDIAPFFGRVRFYPAPAERPSQGGGRLFLQDVGRTVEALEEIAPNLQVMAQKEAVEIWAPLYDRIVGLFLETVDGTPPILLAGPDGKSLRTATGGYVVTGGWPCRRYPDDWPTRASDTLAAHGLMRQEHTLCGRPDRRKDGYFQLRDYLGRCLADPQSLTGRDVGRIRLLLARYVTRRGVPDSVQCRTVRDEQRHSVARPAFRDIARIVARRLDVYPRHDGLDDPEALVHAVTADEAAHHRVADGTVVPPTLKRKLLRCRAAGIDALVEHGIVKSAETLARLLPQITAQLRAAGVVEPGLRQIHVSVYQAFRRRRSLLLVDLQSQVRLEELPWIAAIETFRRDDLPAQALSRQALEDVAVLTLATFPQAIVPNKLLQELRALAKTARRDLPFVDELAADIFMGRFSAKFPEAAKRAADLLEGTLYATYYDVDYGEVRRCLSAAPGLPAPWLSRFWNPRPKNKADPFAALCARRAGVEPGSWNPTINGMIIEQQQIVTSQNLAVLFGEPGVADRLRGRLAELARCCFEWICRHLQMRVTEPHAGLILVKQAAYAWRQMVFFLALLPRDDVGPFLSWAEAHLDAQPPAFRHRFAAVLRGLVSASEGRPPSGAPPTAASAACRFLGWSKGWPWVLEAVNPKER